MERQYEVVLPSAENEGYGLGSTQNGQYETAAVAEDEDDRNMDEIAQVECLLVDSEF